MKKLLSMVAGVILGVFSLFGCSITDIVNYTYADGERYTVGGGVFTEEIQTLDVDWMSGDVQILPSTDNAVYIQESCTEELNTEKQMYHLLDGTSLRIRYTQSGKPKQPLLNKKLTVYVPAELTRVQLSSSAATVKMGAVTVSNLSFELASGELRFEDTTVLQNLSVSLVAGNVNGSMTATDARFDFEVGAGTVNLKSSGCQSFDVRIASGDVTLRFDSMPELGEIDTASGTFTMGLPTDAQFTVDLDVLTGDFYTDFTHSQNGKHVVVGAGTSSFKVVAVSGGVKIYKN